MKKEDENHEMTFGEKCDCGSTDTILTGYGGYQDADASRSMPMIEGDEIACNVCGRTWWS